VNENRRDVLFIDASRDYQSAKTRNLLLEEHIDKIVAMYKTRKDVDKYSHAATLDEIKENDFNLNIPRYVDTFEEEEEIDITAVQREIDQLEGELVEVRGKMKKYLSELSVE
jgi:type I restriction enzyme M protein